MSVPALAPAARLRFVSDPILPRRCENSNAAPHSQTCEARSAVGGEGVHQEIASCNSPTVRHVNFFLDWAAILCQRWHLERTKPANCEGNCYVEHQSRDYHSGW